MEDVGETEDSLVTTASPAGISLDGQLNSANTVNLDGLALEDLSRNDVPERELRNRFEGCVLGKPAAVRCNTVGGAAC
jgi:hypothetical protein